ncbi:hypothetical protein AMJ52_02425 [candidate division TA06 bacterium DG_78]|uniref:Uncharacterized protein n=1 Tax=candidate division TA06 bacterium DG_78 TaxID=1703772 RepID=A0A0S7YH20_UNCT6|nr:MAG: hypothetical protein AMJ52_02425 [candidate division TA06 bacterium DG_78]
MKIEKSISCIVIALLLQCTYGVHYYDYHDYELEQPIVISERIGETIDPEEREQYDLFPGIENFTSATFYVPSTIGYAVEIVIEDKKYISVNREPMAVEILCDFFEKYEYTEKFREEFETEWAVVTHDDIGFPITQDEIDAMRHPTRVLLLGATGGCLLGIIPGALIGLAIGFSVEHFGELAVVYAGPGALIGGGLLAVIGASTARSIDKNNALEDIKESRRLREIK